MPFTFTEDSATIGTTEYSLPNDSTTLTPQTNQVMLQVFLALNAMAAGDQYQIRINEKVNTSADTQRTVYESIVTGVQPFLWVSPSLLLGTGWDVTVKKLAGTDRAIGWSLRKVT